MGWFKDFFGPAKPSRRLTSADVRRAEANALREGAAQLTRMLPSLLMKLEQDRLRSQINEMLNEADRLDALAEPGLRLVKGGDQ